MFTESGEVRCICPVPGTERPLVFHGFEADRGTLKYHCPAAVYDLDCASRAACEAAGRCRTNGYRSRSALERINSRLD